MKIGAFLNNSGRGSFCVWAPFCGQVDLEIADTRKERYSMVKNDRGYWTCQVDGIVPGTRYAYRLNGEALRPDPASRFQPGDVHGFSEIVDHAAYRWQDKDWTPVPLEDMIIYEIHVGTFTPNGTFEAVIPRLKELSELGINTIELMPVAQFPGERNWGYDGVHPFAVQNSYGGPGGLKKLVDACHQNGIAVILDVVYNHLGPEGNYLHDFGPYFTDRHKTPWGKAINFDDAYNNEVRHYFIQNALYWFEQFHIDGLRLDAVHAIYDFSAKPFLRELKEAADHWSQENQKTVYLIAESDLNDVRLIQSPGKGGFDLDAQWSDDFHHAVHSLLTGESEGYYEDFGKLQHLQKALTDSFVYDWEYSRHRRRYHGNSAKDLPAEKFCVSIQNHDQVGNRVNGERLSRLVSMEGQKLAAGVLIFSPYVPLIFMGEEYGERQPFLYFVSHGDEQLIESVRRGRKAEFASFKWTGEPPDPQDVNTFNESKLRWEDRMEGSHGILLKYWKELIRLRRETKALRVLDRKNIEVTAVEDQNILLIKRWQERSQVLMAANFSNNDQTVELKSIGGRWSRIIDSFDRCWGGPGKVTDEYLTSSVRLTLGPFQFAAFKRN